MCVCVYYCKTPSECCTRLIRLTDVSEREAERDGERERKRERGREREREGAEREREGERDRVSDCAVG